ncbi:hypothetical protein Salat_0272800 [Sesamum alatum]|uniref:Bifunctional inhibitor/plant lipid transfer protein/seed storage helical domain-containing protein n=1 Tax=Sesamum alatum TaxID=300844 RepID=A0AAE1YZL3_9LAMI|nr:hypothetical protein Salat_0272800 [Sesamum alatum]
MVKMMLVFLVALVLSTNPVKATDCLSVFASITPCASYLANSLPILPGTHCCDAATNVVSIADTDSLCQCFRQTPVTSSFIPSKAQQLPSLCNLNSFVPLANCLVPSEDNVFPLPPVTPLPPLVPFPPLLPAPLHPVPLPPLFPFPLPPLVPIPVQPVPLPPLVPIPVPPLPPLVPIPVPPVA